MRTRARSWREFEVLRGDLQRRIAAKKRGHRSAVKEARALRDLMASELQRELRAERREKRRDERQLDAFEELDG